MIRIPQPRASAKIAMSATNTETGGLQNAALSKVNDGYAYTVRQCTLTKWESAANTYDGAL